MNEHDAHVQLYEGVVYDNRDPLRIGRVRVTVPGLLEPYSNWALPVGGVGGGDVDSGFWQVPSVGANVSILFREGDPDHPRFFSGSWGAPAGSPESPSFVRNLSPVEAVQVSGIETKRWNIVLDDRPGQESLVIRDRMFEGNLVEIDGVAQGVTINGTVSVQIKSSGVVNIQAMQVIINGRPVLPSGKPI